MTRVCVLLVGIVVSLVISRPGSAASTPAPCARPAAGAAIARPADLYSQNGALSVTIQYLTGVDSAGRTLFCFRTFDGFEAPTLHVRPGDRLDVAVTNLVPHLPPSAPVELVSNAGDVCGDATMTGTSMNMHFHGTNTSPACHGDQVVHTLINSGETFRYTLAIPADEPPGLYWYHTHVHGLAEAAVLGGASGAIIVDGIQSLQPVISGLPERLLVLRDQTVGAAPVSAVPVPAWDVSVNYVPVSYPDYMPAAGSIVPGQSEFWRVVNAGADTIMDLAVLFDGHPQTLGLVGLDGVPINSQDGTRIGSLEPVTHVFLAPGSRAEFVVSVPGWNVKRAELVTRAIDTGPAGDFDPGRTLLVLHPSARPDDATRPIGLTEPAWPQRFEGLDHSPVTARRKLYFSELISDPDNPASPTNFFITVDGATPVVFDPAMPPAITTTQGAVEDWTIENRSPENHEFHIHQIHFKLLAANGVPVPPGKRQFMDVIQIPYWSGKGPYPSVTVRMDFRGPDVGDFVYHCHILGHEDNGMMAIIRVLPKS